MRFAKPKALDMTLERWERSFRKAAKADDLILFRDHLQRLDLPNQPERLLHGTILVVRACCAYAKMEGRSYGGFLSMQSYRPEHAGSAKYSFTFDLYGKAYARLLVPAGLEAIDLADLFDHPWHEYEVCGYGRFWVSRTDGQDLSSEERAQIETGVTDDLSFDYSEDELGFWFDDSAVKGALLVSLQDLTDLPDPTDAC